MSGSGPAPSTDPHEWWQVIATRVEAKVDGKRSPRALGKGWCGVLQWDRAAILNRASTSDMNVTINSWYQGAQGIYTTKLSHESLVHVSFATEQELLDAMQRESKAGLLHRCSGRHYSCAHLDDQIKELVVLNMEWSSSRMQPPMDGAAEKGFLEEVKKKVSSSCGAVVDKMWLRKASNSTRAKCYVHLQLHSSADVDKVLKVEKKFADLHNAMAVAVDVPNSPAMKLCSHCQARGHGNPIHCPKMHVEEFAIQAVFNESVSETDKRASHGGVQTSGCLLNHDNKLTNTCVLRRKHSQEA